MSFILVMCTLHETIKNKEFSRKNKEFDIIIIIILGPCFSSFDQVWPYVKIKQEYSVTVNDHHLSLQQTLYDVLLYQTIYCSLLGSKCSYRHVLLQNFRISFWTQCSDLKWLSDQLKTAAQLLYFTLLCIAIA